MVPDQRSLESLTVQQNALLTFMQHRSEENWCAAWYSDLQYALLDAGTQQDRETYRWLVEQAGGWFTWDAHEDRRFVLGAPSELEDAAAAHRTQPGRR